ncbi:hypothetical protein B566_EDAN012844 [Ephemera danica]|nr:hypothetical protein B566_EDAN012844 [Ephemera danica]
MLKHLCVCHSRFNFVYKPRESSASHIVVEVTLNVRYDGSYEGNAWNLLAQPNQVFEDPQNRSSITELLVWRKIPQPPPSFNEFLPTKKPAVQQRPNKIGHNRVYFHFGTWLPYISPKEMETESDNEGLDWHPENSRREMNDFTDVNEGEKVVMNEWNTFVSVKFKILAVNQVVPACRMFIQQCGPSLLKQKLYRNVVLHFVCLHDFGILSATDLYPLILELQQLASTISDLKHESADAMEIDSMFDKENQLHPQSPSTKEWRKPRVTEDFNQKMTDAEDLNQVALMPNTAHATNKKDAIQSWVTAYQHWLSKNKEL